MGLIDRALNHDRQVASPASTLGAVDKADDRDPFDNSEIRGVEYGAGLRVPCVV
jgi:hypothetical protein